MRVYLPATIEDLRSLHDSGAVSITGTGYAATSRLAHDLEGLSDEETEFALTSAAAEASLAALGDGGATSGRRIVLVGEISDGSVVERDDAAGVVSLSEPMRLSDVAAILMDSVDVDVVLGSDDDLGWYATQELGLLLA